MKRGPYRKEGVVVLGKRYRTWQEAATAHGVSVGYIWGKCLDGLEGEIGAHPRCGVKYAKKRLAR